MLDLLTEQGACRGDEAMDFGDTLDGCCVDERHWDTPCEVLSRPRSYLVGVDLVVEGPESLCYRLLLREWRNGYAPGAHLGDGNAVDCGAMYRMLTYRLLKFGSEVRVQKEP